MSDYDPNKVVPIPDWDEYLIDTKGNVSRVAPNCGAVTGRILKWSILKNGYAKVSLCRNAIRKEYFVHRLVAMAFIGDPTGFDVCHYDGNKLNNDVSNLRIDNRKGNMSDQIRMHKTPRGEKSGSNKYATEFITQLKRRLMDGETVTNLHRETKIPRPTLYSIRSGATWGWLCTK